MESCGWEAGAGLLVQPIINRLVQEAPEKAQRLETDSQIGQSKPGFHPPAISTSMAPFQALSLQKFCASLSPHKGRAGKSHDLLTLTGGGLDK